MSGIIGASSTNAKIVGDSAKLNADTLAMTEQRYQQETGVNLDEELANLQLLQNAYAASARLDDRDPDSVRHAAGGGVAVRTKHHARQRILDLRRLSLERQRLPAPADVAGDTHPAAQQRQEVERPHDLRRRDAAAGRPARRDRAPPGLFGSDQERGDRRQGLRPRVHQHRGHQRHDAAGLHRAQHRSADQAAAHGHLHRRPGRYRRRLQGGGRRHAVQLRHQRHRGQLRGDRGQSRRADQQLHRRRARDRAGRRRAPGDHRHRAGAAVQRQRHDHQYPRRRREHH